MALADRKVFAREHIDSQRFGTSQELAEQAVHSLELVAELSASGLSFQFKGGSSLLLILDSPRRFSIDVDIASDEPRERIEECLGRLAASYGVFTRWEPRRHKTKPWLPISSYYLYYASHFAQDGEGSIMLDVQLRRSPYKTVHVPVACGTLYTSAQTVELPLAASIVGDKLLTMGPFSLGIPLGKGKQAQRLKHVFDVACLTRTQPGLDDIRESLFACLEHENEIQDKSLTPHDVMTDTVAFCATTAASAVKPALDSVSSPVLKENVDGLDDFAGHLFRPGYGWTELQEDMSLAALCIAASCTERVTAVDFSSMTGRKSEASCRLPPGMDIGTEAARYYWQQTMTILGTNPLSLIEGHPLSSPGRRRIGE